MNIRFLAAGMKLSGEWLQRAMGLGVRFQGPVVRAAEFDARFEMPDVLQLR
jgi:hypothetical protein